MNGGLTSLDLFFAILSGAVSVKDKLMDLNQPSAEVAINNA
jgi:hypothetical protein